MIFKMHVNGSSTPSLTLNNTTLSTNNIAGSVGTFSYIACAGTTGRPILPTAVGDFLGADGNGGYATLEVCANTGCYIDFGQPNLDYTGRFMFIHASASFNWYIGAATSTRLTLSATSLIGPTYSATSDKRLKFNENHKLMH